MAVDSVQDLDKFLSSPLDTKQKQTSKGLTPPPAAPAQKTEEKPSTINSFKDLDSFLAKPIGSGDKDLVDRTRRAKEKIDAGAPSISAQHPDLIDKIKNRLGDVSVYGNFTLRDAYKNFEQGVGHVGTGDINDPLPKWREEHAGKPLTVTSALEAFQLGTGQQISSLLSGENLAMLLALGGAPIGRGAKLLIDAGFSGQMAYGAAQGIKQAHDAFQRGDAADGVMALTEVGPQAAFAWMSGRGAFHEGEVLNRGTRMRDYALGQLDKLSQAKYGKAWNALTQPERADITYGLATAAHAPLTAATAQRLGVKMPGEDRPGLEQAARVAGDHRKAMEGAMEAVPVQPVPEPPPAPEPKEVFAPEKVHPEGPDFYELNVRPMSAEERDSKRYSLQDARKELDAERAKDKAEKDRIDAEETERMREARERRDSGEAERQYRAQREGKELVVSERRGLRFNTEGAEANAGERQRLTSEMDRMAEEHMYVDSEDMIRSIETEKARGRELDSWKKNMLKLDGMRKDLERLSDPAKLAPKRTDVFKGAAEDIDLSDREQGMRDSASRLREQASKIIDNPEEFERVREESEEAQHRAEEIKTRRDLAFAARAAQTADRQVYPVGPPIDLQMGEGTSIVLPDGRRLRAHYAIANGDDLVTSHNPVTFDWNDDYQPREMQPRNYATNQEAQTATISGGMNFEPDRVHSDDPSPHNGPPVILRDGRVVGGNGREMRRQRAYRFGNGDSVYRHLRQRADRFGRFSVDAGQKPSLVRVLDEDVERVEDLIALGRDLNRTETMGFDTAEQAVIAGHAMNMHMLEWASAQMDSLGEDASLRDFMRARGNEIVSRMMNSGMIEPTKRAAFITRDGEMTEAAKDLFEAAFLGKVVDDPELLKTTPKEILRKLGRGVIGLVKAKVAGGMWDISPEVKESLRVWKRVDSVRDSLNEIGTADDSLIDKYYHPDRFKNGSMLMEFSEGRARELPNPEVEAIAKLLEMSQAKVRDGFSDYGNDAEGKQMVIGEPPRPVESFNKSVGAKVGIEVPERLWGTMERPIPAPKSEPKIERPVAAPVVPAESPEIPPAVGGQDELVNFLQNHPGFGRMARPIVTAADILSRNATGLSLDEFMRRHVASVTASRDVTGESLSQLDPIRNWIKKSGKSITVEPYGEQLGIFGDNEKAYMLRNKKGQDVMVLQSQLETLKREFPNLGSLVNDEGDVTQGSLFKNEGEENIFGPGKDEDDDQKLLFDAAMGKGATRFLDDGRAIIHLFENADTSTFLHEFFHTMRRHLKEGDAKVLEDWLKIKDSRWSRDAEERAARAFEYYHRQREIRTLPERVRAVFEKMQNAMKQIYASLKGSPLVKPSEEVSKLFDRWYDMDEVPEAPREKAAEKTRKGASYRNGLIADEGKGRVVVYDKRGREAGVFPDKIEATKFIDEKTSLGHPLVDGIEPVPEISESKPAAELETPPLTPQEREGQSLVAEGGKIPLDTGRVRVKVFDSFDPAREWSTNNKAKIRSLQLHKLTDGRYVADFVPKNEKILFQAGNFERIGELNQEIKKLEDQLQRILPDKDRQRIAGRLFDLKSERENVGQAVEQAKTLEPPPGKVIKLWTPEGDLPVAEKEVTSGRGNTIREVSDGLAPVPERPGTERVHERAGLSRVPKPESGSGRAPRSDSARDRTRGNAGRSGESLPGVEPVVIAEPKRLRRPPTYTESDWKSRVEKYRLPANAPAPTVRIPDELARSLMAGQPEIVESVLSGLDQHDAYILASQTGTGKTYMGSAVISEIMADNPDAKILIKTPSRTLIEKEDGWRQVAADFGVDVQDYPIYGVPDEPGVYAVTWAASLNRDGIEQFPWDLVIADEAQEARRWFADSKRGQQMKTQGENAKKVLYMSATPFHTALEIGHMSKLGLWDGMGFDTWAKQMGVYRDSEGNLAGGRAPMKLSKLRQQLIERGQMINIDRNMEGYSAHFGVIPMDGKTRQGLENIQKAMDLAENYFKTSGKLSKVRPTRAQATTLAKRWLEYQRLPEAIELANKLEKQGWKAIIFSENKKEFDEMFEFLKEADEGTGGQISALLPKFRNTAEVLQDHFGDDIGIFAGRQSAARDQAKADFNSGEKKHIYATYGAGGVGVSLHDKVGNAPRAAIYLGPPWSGISFDQALGRPWRYGTKSNVRAYFLFSDARPEMDLIQNKVAPRMESLRAMVSGVHLNDPMVKALRSVPETREATLDYDLGNEHTATMDDYTKAGDTRTVSSYSELPIVSADEAKNKGMKLPGSEGATRPGIVKLFQEDVEEENLPADMDAPEIRRARQVNIDLAERFIDTGAAPGNTNLRTLSPPERRVLADAAIMEADRAAREYPGAAMQQVYTAWENTMRRMDAYLSVGGDEEAGEGGDGMAPPPSVGSTGDMENPPGSNPTREPIGKAQALNWYLFTNGRDVIRSATRMAGVSEVGEKLARSIAQYHVEGGNISGPWTTKYWDILKDNGLSAEEHKVMALTMANREQHKSWIDRELARLRAETPMNERIAKAVEDVEKLRKDVFNRLQKDGIYLTAYDAASGASRRINYADMDEGNGYWPRRYNYDEVHTVVDPKTGQNVNFTLRDITKNEGPGESKREAIIAGMMDRHGFNRAEVEDWMQKRRRVVPLMGHVERAREADIPFFRTDPEVMISYLEGAGELLARKKYFGQEGEKVSGSIASIPDEKARNVTKEIIDQLLKRDPMQDEKRFLMRTSADWSVLSKMTFSSIKVLGHPAHGALLTNTRAFLRAMLEGVADHKDAVRRAQLAGSIQEQTKVEMLSEYGVNKKGLASAFLRFNGWQAGYKWGRVVADANARVYMEKYALPELMKNPDNQVVRRQMHDFLLLDNEKINHAIERGRWNADDLDWGGKALSDKVMFTFDPTELPPAWRAKPGTNLPVSDTAVSALRLATMMKGYQFKTHALLKDAIWDEARKGNFRPLIPFMTLYPLLGQLIWSMTSLAAANSKHFKDLMSSDAWTPANTLKRYVEDIAHMIGDTQLTATLSAIVNHKENLAKDIVNEYILGPVYSDIARSYQYFISLASKRTNDQRMKLTKRYMRQTFPVTEPALNLVDDQQQQSGGSMLPPPPPPQ